MSKTRLLFLLAYDGTRFFGWQKTKEGPSIEAEVEQAASTILQEPVFLQAASRTDRGVHASGQVIDCRYTKEMPSQKRFVLSMNQLLPNDIRVMKTASPPSLEFHPTLSAIKKRYLYRLAVGPVCPPNLRFTHWHIPYILDQRAVKESLCLIEGTHDFKAFSNWRKGLCYPHTERTIYRAELNVVHESGYDLWTFILEGDHFLYKMARTIVGTLVFIGRGMLQKEELKALFSSRERTHAGMTAPACGLELNCVMYKDSVW